MIRTSLRAAVVAFAATAALALGTGSAFADPVDPNEPGGAAYNGVDDIVDGLTCDGPLGGLLNQLVNCDPEDEPPFTSVPDEESTTSQDDQPATDESGSEESGSDESGSEESGSGSTDSD